MGDSGVVFIWAGAAYDAFRLLIGLDFSTGVTSQIWGAARFVDSVRLGPLVCASADEGSL